MFPVPVYVMITTSEWDKIKGNEIAALAEQGDPTAEQSLQAYERRLAKALAAYMKAF